MTEADRLTRAVLELDVDEKRAHEKVWEKRGKMASRLKRVIGEIHTEVSVILEGTMSDEDDKGTT